MFVGLRVRFGVVTCVEHYVGVSIEMFVGVYVWVIQGTSLKVIGMYIGCVLCELRGLKSV